MSETTPQTQTERLDTRTFEEKVKDISKNAMSIAPLLCAIGIAIWWIFYGMVEIEKVNLAIGQRIGLTICTVFLAVTYCKLVASGGFKSAKSTPTWHKLTDDWTNAITKGNSKKKEIIEYAKDIAKSNQKEVRTENLEKNGLNYYEFFDDNGNLINLNYKNNKYNKRHNKSGYTKKQIRIIGKCIDLRIEIPEMFGNLSSKFFGIKKRTTQKQYEMKTDLSQTIVRAIIALFSVGLMFKFMGTSWGSVIYALFQIVMWTGSGVLQRIKNYNFVINELQPQILENTLVINGYLQLNEEQQRIYEEKAHDEMLKKQRLLIECK